MSRTREDSSEMSYSSSEDANEPKSKNSVDSTLNSFGESGLMDATSRPKSVPGHNKAKEHKKQLEPICKPGPNPMGSQRPLPSPKTSPNYEQHNTGTVQRREGGNNSRSDSIDSTSSTPFRPHTGGDVRWEAINAVNSRDAPIGLSHFRLLKRLGYGDIGSVYLVELRGTNTHYAMKVMDKASLVSRNKLFRAQTEREILGLLDHPFLPTLYSHFETEKFYCFVMEFCSGGNLHSLRQKQPNKHFTDEAARFYASEVLFALGYLHMLGIVYRDLQPENVLVRDEGHIMLSEINLKFFWALLCWSPKMGQTHRKRKLLDVLNDDFKALDVDPEQ